MKFEAKKSEKLREKHSVPGTTTRRSLKWCFRRERRCIVRRMALLPVFLVGRNHEQNHHNHEQNHEASKTTAVTQTKNVSRTTKSTCRSGNAIFPILRTVQATSVDVDGEQHHQPNHHPWEARTDASGSSRTTRGLEEEEEGYSQGAATGSGPRGESGSFDSRVANVARE